MKSDGSQTIVALVDTSVQVDRVKTAARRDRIDELLSGYDLRVTTTIALLEFKATVIQECITIHNALRRDGRFTAVRDALVESGHRQHRLRAHIFNNLLNTFAASSFEVTPEQDRRLAEKARLHLGDQIPLLYRWFRSESVDAILDKKIGCTRANEPPQKRNVAFSTNLPRCKRGSNKWYRVEDLVRAEGPALSAALQSIPDRPEQINRAISLFDRVRGQPEIDVSHSECRSAGDTLIALEACDHASHVLSTNATEWELLARCLGLEFVRVDYPNERKK